MKPENVLPRWVYDLDESGRWKRMPWVVGPLYAFLTALMRFRDWLDGSRDFIPWCVSALFEIGFTGLAMGVCFPLFAREMVRRHYDGLYNGEERGGVAPKGEERFRYRMPAALVDGSKRPVWGVLLIGRPGIFFIPGKRSSPKCKPIEMGPVGGIVLHIVDPPAQTLRQRLFIPTPQKLLEFSRGQHAIRFKVPIVDYTTDRLGGFLSALQAKEAKS